MEFETVKTCSVCKKEKNIGLFYKRPKGLIGFVAHCKQCHAIRVKNWRSNNPDKRKKTNRTWFKNNIEKARSSVRKSCKKWRENNPEKAKHKNKASYIKWKENDPERARKASTESSKRWRINSPEKAKVAQDRSNKKRRKELKVRISDALSTNIRICLKGSKNGRHWEDLVGYTLNDLVKRLKATLPAGYTWDDFINGNLLHIDHIIPISVHNFKTTDDIDFNRCWALKNLRLLTAKENLSKGSKINRPFQPSLIFGQKELTNG